MAKTASANSIWLPHMTATASPASRPRRRNARTSWLARAFNSAKETEAVEDVTAGTDGIEAAHHASAIPFEKADSRARGSGTPEP